MDPFQITVIAACVVGLFVGAAAAARGRSFIGWTFLCLLLTIPSGIVMDAVFLARPDLVAGQLVHHPATVAAKVTAVVGLPAGLCLLLLGLGSNRRSTGETRPCPHCTKALQTAAKVCRFCGRDLPAGWSTAGKDDRLAADRKVIGA